MIFERRVFLTHEEPAVLAVVIAIVVEVLRSDITEAWMDAFTQGEWRPEQSADVAALLALEQGQILRGVRRNQTGMGIDLDLDQHDEIGLLARLAPFTIHTEAWAGRELVFSASDAGDHAWFALMPDQERQVHQRLQEVGLASDDVLVLPTPRRRFWT